MDDTPSVNSAAPVIQAGQSKPAEKLDKAEKTLATLLVILGVLLVVGTLVWFGVSSDGNLKSKETVTTEPVGGASGQKEVKETEYAEAVTIFALTIGAVLIISGAFFGRIREIKLGTATVVVGGAPEEEKKAAQDKAAEKAEELAPPEKEEEAGKVARTLAAQQVDLAYLLAPVNAKAGVADTVANAVAPTAAEAVQ
jgi:hypothetical protein